VNDLPGKIVGRRALLLAGGKAALLAGLAGRLYYLQVDQGGKYTTLADENRINLRLLAPSRGRILDRHGTPMAVNEENYRVQLVSEEVEDLGDTLDTLGAIFPLSDHDRIRIQREIHHRRGFIPVTVRENLSWEEVSRIELNSPDLSGVVIDVGETRAYPLVDLGAHLVGYVSAVSEAELQKQAAPDPLLELPGFRVGKAGVEKVCDLALRGKGGTCQVEVNSVGRTIRELKREEGEPGADLALTIDLDLQKFAAQRLGDDSASVVVMDIHSGELLVMASTPSFDPNAFNRGLTAEEWQDLSANPRAPMTNKAVAGLYPPGSTFKTMVSLAALESGAITPDHTVTCTGKTMVGNTVFYCDGRHGVKDLRGAIQVSCDSYFYDVAHRVGIDAIAAMARRFGLGSSHEIGLPGEKAGLVPNRAWKRATYGVSWTPGEDCNVGLGQGYLQVTPLQLAVMAARLANGGKAVRPHLTRDLVDGHEVRPRPAPSFEAMGLSPQALEAVLDGLNAVTNQPGGTAYAARILDPAIAMGGKTGAAQVHHLAIGEHKIEGGKRYDQLPWRMRDHGLFIGFAPVSAPRFAVAVVVEHGGSGVGAAAPIARDVLAEVQKRHPIAI
jgi:penicillin-binding protein 2